MRWLSGLLLAVVCLSACTAAQQQVVKQDEAKALAVLQAVAKDAPADLSCSAAVIAATAAGIASGDYIAILEGWACVPSAAYKLYQDIKAGLASVPSDNALQMATSVAVSVKASKAIAAPLAK